MEDNEIVVERMNLIKFDNPVELYRAIDKETLELYKFGETYGEHVLAICKTGCESEEEQKQLADLLSDLHEKADRIIRMCRIMIKARPEVKDGTEIFIQATTKFLDHTLALTKQLTEQSGIGFSLEVFNEERSNNGQR